MGSEVNRNRDEKIRRLYTEYREAMRQRDEKEAYRKLRQIAEINPEDAKVKLQCESFGLKLAEQLAADLSRKNTRDEKQRALKELETLFPSWILGKVPAYVKGKQDAGLDQSKTPDLRTKELYHRLREALLARKKEAAFDLLEEICEIDPADSAARKQKAETGIQLSKQYSGEMIRLTHAEDIQPLCDLVDRMRRWATSSALSDIDGYNNAVALVDGFRRNEAAQRISQILAAVRTDGGMPLEGRMNMVREVEGLAARYNISLSGEESELTRTVRQQWDDEESRRVGTEKVEQLAERFAGIPSKTRLFAPAAEQLLTERMRMLDEIADEAKDLGDLPGVKELLCLVKKGRQRIKKTIKLRSTILLLGRVAVVFLAIMIGLTIHAYNTAGSAMEELNSALAEMNISKLRDLTATSSVMRGAIVRKITLLVNTDYKVMFEKGKECLERHDRLLRMLDRGLAQIDEFSRNMDIRRSSKYVAIVHKIEDICEELKEFKTSPGKEVAKKLNTFKEKIRELKPRAIARYESLPRNLSLPELNELYVEFKEVSRSLDFTPEQSNIIRENFRSAVSDILLYRNSQRIPTAGEMNKSMELFEQYRESMELDKVLQDEIVQRQKGVAIIASGDADNHLRQCTTFKEYRETLESWANLGALPKIPNACDTAFLKNISDQLIKDQSLVVAAAECEVFPKKRELNRKLLESIKSIFDKSANVYLEYNSSIGRAIDLLTEDDEGMDLWCKNLEAVESEGMIYPGSISGGTDGMKKTVRLLNLNGEPSGDKKMDLPVESTWKWNLSNLREKLGFERIPLQRGNLLPIDLLKRTAEMHKSSSCPMLAAAWLFKQTIDLMEAYPEPLANGIALSPSLREDIGEFKKLDHQMNLVKGCWFLPHKKMDDEKLRAFFARVADRDYKGEIDGRLKYILSANFVFAGFVGEDNHLVIVPAMRGKPLYFLSMAQKMQALPASSTNHARLQRFTPLFSIVPPIPFPKMQGKTT